MTRTFLPVALLGLLSLPVSATAAVNLEARGLGFSRGDATYGASDEADLVLAYRTSGDPKMLSDIRVEVEIRSSPAQRLMFRLRETQVPQTQHDFHMPVDLSTLDLGPGTYTVVASIDSDDVVRETSEDDNDARTSLVIRRAGADSGPGSDSGSSSTPPPSSGQQLRPSSAKVVSESTCSELGREWKSPLEVGWHPGYGWAHVVLRFDDPWRALGYGETLQRLTLKMSADRAGSPFEDFGALDVTVQPVGSDGLRCEGGRSTHATLSAFTGQGSLDLGDVVSQREAVSRCGAIEVQLAFPERALSADDAARLLRIDPQSVSLQVGTTRR